MAINQKYGFAIDQILASAQALATGATTSTNVATINNRGGDAVHIVVTAAVNITIGAGKILKITPYVGLADNACTVALPTILITQGVQTTTTYLKGDVIAQIVIPSTQIGKNKFLCVKHQIDTVPASAAIDIFTVVR